MTDSPDSISDFSDSKFYSQKTIAIATYIGGPLAAAILMRQNYINAGSPEMGQRALLIGIVSTILLFTGIFLIPESVIENIPPVLIPAVYTGIIYVLVEQYFGEVLRKHQASNGEFYSGWKAAGVGAGSLALLMVGILAYVYFGPEDFDTERYDQGIAEFQQNENKAMTLFDKLGLVEANEAVAFIKEAGIPNWEKNLRLLNEMDQIEGLYPEYMVQNQKLREYCELRIQSFRLISKAIEEETDSYDVQIDDINQRIDEILERM